MSKDIRLALAGDMGHIPLPLLYAMADEDVRFEAICDPNPSRTDLAVRTYGARWPFNDIEQMLREAEPDAVIVAAPNSQRAQLAKTCLRHRSAVLLLGAPGRNLTECRALARAARQANRQLMVGLPQRFSPAGSRAQRLLESGRLGPVAAVEVALTWPRSPDPDEGSDLSLPFDLVFDAADRLRRCAVEPERIWAVARPYGHIAAMVLATDGVVATLGLHHAGTPQAAGSRLEVRSEDGGLLVVEDDVNLICTAGSQLVARHQPRFGAGDDPRVEQGFAGMIAAFVTALRDRRGVPFGLPSATGSVALAAAIFKAARTSRPVNFQTR